MECINQMILPELLSPAGSFEHLKGAVYAGADAVYMGGQKFGARAYAENFSGEEVMEALRFAHFHDVRLYLTVNTLMKEWELEEQLTDFLFPYYEAGLDGVIVQDLGAASLIHRCFPKMEVHGSTQMTITSMEGALAAKRMGMTRIVPARELSMEEILAIKKATGLDLEVFIHGALCDCYSGQCLFSSTYGGRSGNRGRCAQPCRLPYRLYDQKGRPFSLSGEHLLSPKDLCSLERLPELLGGGVDSLKIEGRMKNVEYVAGVTAIYRKYLNWLLLHWEERGSFLVEQQDKKYLEELYSRDGFTDGYWHRHNGRSMMSVKYPKNMGRRIGSIASMKKNQITVALLDEVHPRDILVIPLSNQEEVVLTVPDKKDSPNQSYGKTIVLNAAKKNLLRVGMDVFRRKNSQLSRWIADEVLKNSPKYPVRGAIVLRQHKKAELTLECRGESVCLWGEEVERSANRPITREDILRQMNKTGSVPFVLEDLTIDLEEDSFFPASFLKALRQKGYEALKERLEKRGCRKKEEGTKAAVFQEEKSQTVSLAKERKPSFEREYIAAVYDMEMLTACSGSSFFDSICLSGDFFQGTSLEVAIEKVQKAGKKLYYSMPRVFRKGSETFGRKMGEICRRDVWSGIYVHNINEAQFVFLQKTRPEKKIIAGASFYQWNTESGRVIKELFGKDVIEEFPAELSLEEQEQKKKNGCEELLIYGRIPVMVTAQCLKRTAGRCDKKPELVFLEDKKGRRLPVTTHCKNCCNIIWRDQPRNLIGETMGTLSQRIERFRFDFFGTDLSEVERVTDAFWRWEKNGFCRNPLKESPDEYWNFGIE